MGDLLYSIFMILLIDLVCAFIAMLVWNGFIPNLFGLPKLTFWQAFGIRILCTLFTDSISTVEREEE